LVELNHNSFRRTVSDYYFFGGFTDSVMSFFQRRFYRLNKSVNVSAPMAIYFGNFRSQARWLFANSAT